MNIVQQLVKLFLRRPQSKTPQDIHLYLDGRELEAAVMRPREFAVLRHRPKGRIYGA